VVKLEAASLAVTQQHVGGVAAEEAAEGDEGPIGSHLTQRVARQDRVVADVVDFVLAVGTMAQDHIGGGANWCRRGRHRREEEAVGVSVAVEVIPDDLARAIDALRGGGAQGIIDGGVGATAVKESVEVEAVVVVMTDDLTRVVDALYKGAGGSPGRVDGGVGSASVQEAVGEPSAVQVKPDDLARVVDPLCNGAVGAQRVIDGGVDATDIEETVAIAIAGTAREGIPDPWPQAINAIRQGAIRRRGIVENFVGAAAEKEAVGPTVVPVRPDDLARAIDATRKGAGGRRGIVEAGVGATTVQEAVEPGRVAVGANDL